MDSTFWRRIILKRTRVEEVGSKDVNSTAKAQEYVKQSDILTHSHAVPRDRVQLIINLIIVLTTLYEIHVHGAIYIYARPVIAIINN